MTYSFSHVYNKLLSTPPILLDPFFEHFVNLSSLPSFFEVMKCGEKIRASCFGRQPLVIGEQVTNNVTKLIEKGRMVDNVALIGYTKVKQAIRRVI